MDELDPENAAPVSYDVATDAGGGVIVTIEGELDLSAVDSLNERVAPVLEARPARLVVDVSGLRFADSSAIAMWVRWAAAVQHFSLRNPSPLLRRVIAGMGLSEKLVVES